MLTGLGGEGEKIQVKTLGFKSNGAKEAGALLRDDLLQGSRGRRWYLRGAVESRKGLLLGGVAVCASEVKDTTVCLVAMIQHRERERD